MRFLSIWAIFALAAVGGLGFVPDDPPPNPPNEQNKCCQAASENGLPSPDPCAQWSGSQTNCNAAFFENGWSSATCLNRDTTTCYRAYARLQLFRHQCVYSAGPPATCTAGPPSPSTNTVWVLQCVGGNYGDNCSDQWPPP